MSNQSGGMKVQLSSADLIGAISLSLKTRAFELDGCTGAMLSQLKAASGGVDFNSLKIIDDIFQELIYFSYCLSEVSEAQKAASECDISALLDYCNVAKFRDNLIQLMKSSDVAR